MHELKAKYNPYGDTIEVFTGHGNEEGAINSCIYVDNDICIYRNLNKGKELTSACINNISRIVTNNKDILEYIVNNKLKVSTLLSYLPKKDDSNYKDIIADLNKFLKNNKLEVDLAQLLAYLNSEAP
jgi:hypothetical protein